MYRIPPLAAVRVFEAASRHGNFSRAGEELAMTQAAVSYQIKLLEERLGGALFVRKGRGMALTELGRRIAPQVTDAFSTLNRAFATARSENDAVLSITAPHTFAANWLAGKFGTFQIDHPDVAVRLNVDDATVDLPMSEYDVAIRGMRVADPALVCHFLMRMPVAPMASATFLERHPLRTPADLAHVPRLSPQEEWWELWLDAAAAGEARTSSSSGLRFESQVLDGNAAMAGHGVAILNVTMFEAQLEAGLLVRPFDHIVYHGAGFWLVYPEHKRNLAKIRAFRDWLLEAVKLAAGDDPFGVLEPL
jgi:LysR family transcriptional regulator, glycine cleavage system transcriptional activator